jgi:N-acetylmuramoyl-L-alanine amidase
MMKLILILTTLIFAHMTQAQVILIDPGHGGDEFGAQTKMHTGHGHVQIREKDLALDVAKRIRNLLYNDFRVFMTRSNDRTLTLQERARFAELVNAQLFISIHVNSAEDSESVGFETYFLNNKKNAAVKKVEDVENISMDISPEVHHILTDLVVQRTVDSSQELAEKVHSRLSSSLSKKFGMKDRGVKPGLFYVLALSKIPGLLLEIGFMSNPDELKKLMTEEFRQEYAEKVVQGIKDYFKDQQKNRESLALRKTKSRS